jgi:hypothetical protein
MARRILVLMARNNSTSDAQPDTFQGCALASIIPFAPYLARKRKQQVQCLLARRIHRSAIVEGDIRAWVAAMIEWSARY